MRPVTRSGSPWPWPASRRRSPAWPASRQPAGRGELYGGRTLAYEECLRGDTVRLGADVLDGLRAPLALVLDSARWFTTACGALYERHFEEAYRQRAAALGTDIVPFADIWLLVNDALADPPQLIEPVMSRASAALVGDPGSAAGRPAGPAPGSRPGRAGDIGVPGPATALADGGAPQPRPDDRGRGRRHWRPSHLGARRGPPQHRHHALRHLDGVPRRHGRRPRRHTARPARRYGVDRRDRRDRRHRHAAVQCAVLAR